MPDMTKVELDHARREAVQLYQTERAECVRLSAEVIRLRLEVRQWRQRCESATRKHVRRHK